MNKLLTQLFPNTEIELVDNDSPLSKFHISSYGDLRKYPSKDVFIFNEKFKHPVFYSFINDVLNDKHLIENFSIFKKYLKDHKKNYKKKKPIKKDSYYFEYDFREKKIIMRTSFSYFLQYSMYGNEMTSIDFSVTRIFDESLNVIDHIASFDRTESNSCFKSFLIEKYGKDIIAGFGSYEEFFDEEMEEKIPLLEMMIS